MKKYFILSAGPRGYWQETVQPDLAIRLAHEAAGKNIDEKQVSRIRENLEKGNIVNVNEVRIVPHG